MEYIFDPDVIHECSMQGIGKPKPEMFDAIADAWEDAYPGRIDRSQPWMYSIAGGAMIQMKLYFASSMEYLMIWGTPIGSEGHSGRHAVGFWDTVIDGEMHYFGEGQFERRIYRPGDRVWVGPGQARGMNFTDGVWATEYMRGPIMLSMPFGLADEVLSTLDFATAGQTVGMYMDLLGKAWSQPLPNGDASRNPLRKLAATSLGLMAPLVNRVFATNPPDDAIPSAPSARPPKVLPGRRAARPHIAAADDDRRSAGGE
jgi:C-8 sterol isomerase